MDIDYTKWEPGVALAKEVVLEVCPRCGKSCHPQYIMVKRKAVPIFVHAARVDFIPAKERKPRKESGSTRFKRRNPIKPNRGRRKVVATRWCDQTTPVTAGAAATA